MNTTNTETSKVQCNGCGRRHPLARLRVVQVERGLTRDQVERWLCKACPDTAAEPPYVGDELPRWVAAGVRLRVKATPFLRKYGVSTSPGAAVADCKAWPGDVGKVERCEGRWSWRWWVYFDRGRTVPLDASVLENLARAREPAPPTLAARVVSAMFNAGIWPAGPGTAGYSVQGDGAEVVVTAECHVEHRVAHAAEYRQILETAGLCCRYSEDGERRILVTDPA